MSYHQITLIVLLRLRIALTRAFTACDVQAVWESLKNIPPQLFTYDSKEGYGDERSREQNLRDYIEAHVREVERLRMCVEGVVLLKSV